MKVAFFSGSGGTVLNTKSQAFSNIMYHLEKGSSPSIFAAALTPAEKEYSGGYDALIFIWVKVIVSEKHKKKLLSILRQNE